MDKNQMFIFLMIPIVLVGIYMAWILFQFLKVAITHKITFLFYYDYDKECIACVPDNQDIVQYSLIAFGLVLFALGIILKNFL